MKISGLTRAALISTVLLSGTLKEAGTARAQENPQAGNPNLLKPANKNLVIGEIEKLVSNRDSLRKYVRENINDPIFVYGLARSSFYDVEESDKELARKNPDSLFATGIGENSKIKITREDREFVYKNPKTNYAIALASSPKFLITKEDRDFVRKNPESYLARTLISNENYTIEPEDMKVVLANLDSAIVRGMHGKNFKTDPELARNNPDTAYALLAARSKDFKLTDKDIKYARENPDSPFSAGVAYHPDFKVTAADRKVAREHTALSWFPLAVTSRADYKLEPEDIEIARTHLTGGFVYGVALNPNFKAEPLDVKLARENVSDTFVFILGHPSYPLGLEDLAVAKKNPGKLFTQVLRDRLAETIEEVANKRRK